jgi:hypothetical protein
MVELFLQGERKMKQTKLMTNGQRLMAKIAAAAGLVLLTASTAYAASVSIAQLPEYVRVDHFKLSCTALDGNEAKFFYKKDGGSYSSFGPAINLNTTSCLVDVTSSQIGSEGKYFFKVEVDSGSPFETSTTYDVSGPDNVRDYSKDKTGPTSYRIHWTNPGNSDFYQVFIYRGETSDFSANDDKKVTGIVGPTDTNMSWDDAGLDPNKTYYYIIRALDKAGNSSGLVGDAGTVISTTTVTTQGATGTGQGGESTVTSLPQEEAQGEVLQEATEVPVEEEAGPVKAAVDEAVSRVKTSTVLAGTLIGAFVLGLIWYFASRRRQ